MPQLPRVIIMVDIETLDTAITGVVTQMAFMAVPYDDLDNKLKYDSFYLPIQPQLDAGRTVSAKTLVWWMDQSDAARAKFKESMGDMDTLVAFVRSFIRKIQQVQETAVEYEIWARGPQFDVVMLESLFAMCGEKAPWQYDTVRDLRTAMKLAGLATSDVDSSGFVPHVALEDCRFQIKCMEEMTRRLPFTPVV